MPAVCDGMRVSGAVVGRESSVVQSPPYEVVGDPSVVYRGQWTRTLQTRYRKRGSNKEEVYHSIHRKTPAAGRPHGVEIIATLRRGGKSYFVFVKEYRIPMAGYCFEFPAGLLEEGESVADAANRELKEETGYIASQVRCVSDGTHPMASQITDNSICYALAEVDGDCEENRNPKLHLDESEVIEVVEVECSRALAYVRSISTKYHVDGMVYAFLIGYNATPVV